MPYKKYPFRRPSQQSGQQPPMKPWQPEPDQPAPYQPEQVPHAPQTPPAPGYHPPVFVPVQREPWKPPPRGPGPEMPGEMVEAAELYRAAVKVYIEEKSKAGGSLIIKDGRTGRVHRLALVRFRKDGIVQAERDEAYICAEFRGGAGEKIDLDFRLKMRGLGEWEAQEFFIHRIDGEVRLVYGADGRPRTPEAAAAKAVPKPKQPAKLSVQVAFAEPSGNDMLDGGETGRLSVAVFNAGPGPAYAVRLKTRLEGGVGVSFPAETALGEVAAGKSASAEIPLEASESAASGKVKLRVDAVEGNGFDAEPVLVEFEARAFKAPRLELAGVAIQSGKTIKAGEQAKISVAVRNAGAGAAEGVAAFLSVGSPDIFIAGEPSVSLGSIGRGEAKMADFELFVNRRYKSDGPLPISVALTESRGKYGLAAAPLNLQLGKAPPALKVVAVKGREPAREPEAEAAPAEDDVDQPPKARTAQDPKAFAVLIGVEKYRDLPAVEYASRDAETMREYLTRSMGFDSRNVVVLSDERATLTDMATYLGPWLEDRVEADGRVFVYFAGHGAPNPKTGEGYLVPYDGNPNYVETKAYPVKRLYETLARLPTKDVTVVLDACFSGAGGRSVIAKGARPLVTVGKAPDVGANMAVLTAAAADQISTFQPDARHGLLTYFLLKGLRGGADANADKEITTGELYGFVRPSVEREARRQHVEQTPTLTPDPSAAPDKASRVWVRLK